MAFAPVQGAREGYRRQHSAGEHGHGREEAGSAEQRNNPGRGDQGLLRRKMAVGAEETEEENAGTVTVARHPGIQPVIKLLPAIHPAPACNPAPIIQLPLTIKFLPIIQLLSAIAVPGLLLLFSLDCACGGGARVGGRLVWEDRASTSRRRGWCRPEGFWVLAMPSRRVPSRQVLSRQVQDLAIKAGAGS